MRRGIIAVVVAVALASAAGCSDAKQKEDAVTEPAAGKSEPGESAAKLAEASAGEGPDSVLTADEDEVAKDGEKAEAAAGEIVELAASEDRSVVLSAKPSATDLFDSLTVAIDGRERTFSWKSSTLYDPELWQADVDGDDEKEVVLALTTGSGTGMHLSELHVLNRDFTEVQADDPADVLQKQNKTSRSVKDGKVVYTVTLGGQTYEHAFDESDSSAWFDNGAYFGGIIYYRIEGDTLYAEVPSQVSPGFFPGTANLKFGFGDGRLRVQDIAYTVSDNP